MKKLTARQIIDVFLIVILLIFAGQNVASVHLKFLVFGFDLPLIILIAFVFFIGYLTALLFRKPGKQDNKTGKNFFHLNTDYETRHATFLLNYVQRTYRLVVANPHNGVGKHIGNR